MSSIQVILELCVPVLAVLGLMMLFNEYVSKPKKIKALKISAISSAWIGIDSVLGTRTVRF